MLNWQNALIKAITANAHPAAKPSSFHEIIDTRMTPSCPLPEPFSLQYQRWHLINTSSPTVSSKICSNRLTLADIAGEVDNEKTWLQAVFCGFLMRARVVMVRAATICGQHMRLNWKSIGWQFMLRETVQRLGRLQFAQLIETVRGSRAKDKLPRV